MLDLCAFAEAMHADHAMLADDFWNHLLHQAHYVLRLGLLEKFSCFDNHCLQALEWHHIKATPTEIAFPN